MGRPRISQQVPTTATTAATTATPSYSYSFLRFSQDFQAKGTPARAMLFTTEDLLKQLALASKWSVDGTHRVAPQHFSQLFITMMRVNEKWIPAVHGLLPDHEKNSYRLQFEMIKNAMEKRGLHNNIKSIMSDFELGIQTSAQEAFPGVEIRGCRFHYGQAVWRHAERNFGKILKASKKFACLVRSCLALPFIMTDELQAVVDQLILMHMENQNTNNTRDEFMTFIQNTWIEGVYSSDMWSCFGRKSDHTNNAQESSNSVFNK